MTQRVPDRPVDALFVHFVLVGGLIGACGLLLALFLQAMLSLPLASPSYDEPYDVARGYAYARGADLRMQQEHPVLVDGLGGLMLLLMPELTPPEQVPGWDEAHLYQFSQHLMWRLGHDVDKMVFLVRFPVVLLAMLLAAMVYRWAAEMHCAAGGLLALGLLVFNPNIVAHARVFSTDLGAACFGTVALYTWWRWMRTPSAARLAAAALALGLALAAKTSNLTLLALLIVFTLLYGLKERWRWSRLAAAIAVMGGGALLVLWALYRFEFRPAPHWTGTVPVPAASYWEALAWLQEQMRLGRSAFLGGQYTDWGWWYYFLVVFLIKTPLPFLGLLALAALLHVARRTRRAPPASAVLWFYPLLYFVTSAFSTLNLGYRHILPVVPAMTLFAARVVDWPGLWRRPGRVALAVLAVWLVVGSAAIFPYHLAYFNELVGGPANGYRWLVDSNLDWGQGLKHLKRYLDAGGIDDVWLAYFGSGDPGYYGIRHRSVFEPGSGRLVPEVNQANPQPGWYAISATVLQGPYSDNPDLFDWFRRHQPTAYIGYSILMYHVEPESDPPGWLGVCYAPDVSLGESELTHLLGRTDLRVVGFDCAQAWVLPAGDEPGWYLVPASRDGPTMLSGSVLAEADVAYRQRGLRGGPAFTVYKAPGGCALDETYLEGQAWTSPALAPTGDDPLSALSLPVDLGGELALLGFQLSAQGARPGETIEVTTAWRVEALPASPELSLFVHLVDSVQAVSVGDGLGFSAVQWSPGDVVVQRNRLTVPADLPGGRYWVQVGVYSLVSGVRHPVLQEGRSIADRVLLGAVDVAR